MRNTKAKRLRREAKEKSKINSRIYKKTEPPVYYEGKMIAKGIPCELEPYCVRAVYQGLKKST